MCCATRLCVRCVTRLYCKCNANYSYSQIFHKNTIPVKQPVNFHSENLSVLRIFSLQKCPLSPRQHISLRGVNIFFSIINRKASF